MYIYKCKFATATRLAKTSAICLDAVKSSLYPPVRLIYREHESKAKRKEMTAYSLSCSIRE